LEPNPYLQALRGVAAGRTASFAELARLAGRPAAARAAGRAVAALPTDDPRPWHRIVQSDGGLAPDPERAAIQVERLRAEGARPRPGEDIRAWARRRRARFVGNWRSRALYEVEDERIAGLDPLRVEVLRDDTQTVERGFYFAPPSPVTKPPRPGADRRSGTGAGTGARTGAGAGARTGAGAGARTGAGGGDAPERPARTAAQRRADRLAPETPEEEEWILSGGSRRARTSSPGGAARAAKSKRAAGPKPNGGRAARPSTPRGTRSDAV